MGATLARQIRLHCSIRIQTKKSQCVMLGKCPLFGLSAASLIRERALVSLIALVFAATINAEEPISESADTVLNRAELFYSKKKYEDARREYERAIAIDKGSLAA